MKKALMSLTAAAFLMLPVMAQASTWKIDPDHSSVGFKVRHMMVSNVKGTFHKFSGTVKVDENDLAKSSVTATIETASIDTGVGMRDKDLKSDHFLDVAKYPTMTFVSTGVAKSGAEGLKVTGNLTLHGVTRTVVLDVEGPSQEVKDPKGNVRRGASASTKIDRKDFGLTWNKVMEAGGVMVGDEVTISIEVEMVQMAEP
ncbi:YceI family protein [Geomonas sp.]|uniref:YceI family protein n=1 Tax=Geomonas sp. TaxID=2651584 RepID=UPI002B48F4AD|nr:YceI family protein [Geomonas sp.]HJV33603.1 YceI family protein [Geomonas sp.]